MTSIYQRRAHHPEVDWQSPLTFHHEDDRVIHPRSTGRNYSTAHAVKLCVCGATVDAHDPLTGECFQTGCQMFYEEI